MTSVILAVAVIGGFFILRGVFATFVFYWLLPEGDRCPSCDTPTLRMESRGLFRASRRFRPSWCYACNWHGLLRAGPLTPIDTRSTARQR